MSVRSRTGLFKPKGPMRESDIRRGSVPEYPPGVVPMPYQDLAALHRRLNTDMLSGNPQPLPEYDVPVDLRKRRVQEYQQLASGAMGEQPGNLLASINEWLRRITMASEMIASTLVLRRGLFGRTVTVNSTPSLVARAEYLRGYIFLNPASSIGLTTTTSAFPSTAVSGASGVGAAFGVASYRDVHFFIDVTAIGAGTTLVVSYDALDPISSNWATVQTLVTVVSPTTGTFYIEAGGLGIATDARISWTLTGGTTTATFSVGVVLKNGLGGSTTSGFTNTVYLGSGALSTVNGFPLLEGQSRAFYLTENVELFGIADVDGLELRVFEL